MSRTENRQKLRRENFAKIRAARFKTSAALAEALGDGFAPSYVSQLLSGHRGIGDEVADKIEARLELPSGTLDSQSDTIEDDPELIQAINLFVATYRNSTDEGRAFLKNAVRAVSAGFRKEERRNGSAHVVPLTDRRKQ